MPVQKHDWLIDVFSDIHNYMEEYGLERSAAELQILQLALEKELSSTVVTPPQLTYSAPRRVV